jgi:cysteinyl-tRNA synthetase
MSIARTRVSCDRRNHPRPAVEPLESRICFSALPAAPHAPPAPSPAQAAVKHSPQAGASAAMPLSSVRSFSYVLANLAGSSDVTALAQSNSDMLIVDPNATYKGNANFNMSAMVSQLHAGHPGRVVLAYLDIGEAANFRTYWQSNWRAPTVRHPGSPSFLVEKDPYGWAGSYPVAYWQRAWQNIFLGPNGIVTRVMKAGFDGVFLDWVGAYENPAIAAAARRSGIDPAQAMVNFVSRIRATARSITSNADVIGLNAAELATADPAYLNVVDALAAEDTWFSGTPNAPWDDPAGGDIATDPATTSASIANFQVFQNAGKPVFTIDYALNSEDVNYAYAQSTELGFVPLVTQVSLAQLSTTPWP